MNNTNPNIKISLYTMNIMNTINISYFAWAEIVFLLLTFLPDDEHVVQRPVEKEKNICEIQTFFPNKEGE